MDEDELIKAARVRAKELDEEFPDLDLESVWLLRSMADYIELHKTTEEGDGSDA